MFEIFCSDVTKEIYLSGVNPRYVLRNWMAESAIRRAETKDFSEVCIFKCTKTNSPLIWLLCVLLLPGRAAAPGLVFSICDTRSSRGGRLCSKTTNMGWELESELFFLSSAPTERQWKNMQHWNLLQWHFFIHRNAFSNTINCTLNKKVILSFHEAQVIYLPTNKRQSHNSNIETCPYLSNKWLIVARSGCTAA